jgi:hypothetical protein
VLRGRSEPLRIPPKIKLADVDSKSYPTQLKSYRIRLIFLGTSLVNCILFLLCLIFSVYEAMPPLSRGFQRLRVAHNLGVPRFRVFKRFQSTQRLGSRNGFFKISEEVREALEMGRPVVALETTIYTHG